MFSKNKKPFMEYMAEERKVNRWHVIKIGLFGAFCAACLAAVYFMLSLVV